MKIINYTIMLFFIAIIKVLADDGIELQKIKKDNKDFLVLYQQLSSDVYINELEYQKIKKKADNFKNTNYMVYENFAYKNNNKITACDLINFNQNYITGIYLKRMPKNKESNLYEDLFYEESYITYKNNEKNNIRDAEFFKCGDLDIKNCNENGNDGLKCLEKLPNGCEFVISSKNGSFCINLKNDKGYLMEYGCDNKDCKQLDEIVEYIYD